MCQRLLKNCKLVKSEPCVCHMILPKQCSSSGVQRLICSKLCHQQVDSKGVEYSKSMRPRSFLARAVVRKLRKTWLMPCWEMMRQEAGVRRLHWKAWTFTAANLRKKLRDPTGQMQYHQILATTQLCCTFVSKPCRITDGLALSYSTTSAHHCAVM